MKNGLSRTEKERYFNIMIFKEFLLGSLLILIDVGVDINYVVKMWMVFKKTHKKRLEGLIEKF